MSRTREEITAASPAALVLLGSLAFMTAMMAPPHGLPLETVRISVSSDGEQANGLSFLASISAGGRFVSFTSAASNLVPDDTNGNSDVFVHDRDTAETTRISVSTEGAQGDGGCGLSSISADGRFVAFASTSSNLVEGDTNGVNDVFVRDRQHGTTVRISVSSKGVQSDTASHTPAISDDGRFIAFESAATNLVPDSIYDVWDVYVHDRLTGETSRVSVSSSGAQSNGDSRWASISADGRHVSFTSSATTLVPGTPAFTTQVYVHDRQTGSTTRVSVNADGQAGNDISLQSSISADGRFIAFSSFATNLDPNDQTASEDVFVHDRQTGQTTLVSLSSSGEQGNSWSFRPSISDDGRYVAFVSDASNLVPDDTNGRRDVFVRDRTAATTARVSVSSSGEEGNHNSGFFSAPSISGDGQHVAFESHASNLVEDDTNGQPDIFVHGPAWTSPGNPADLNGDGVVDVLDLLILLDAWGECKECKDCAADINGDCAVDVLDLLILLDEWG
jgi:Tol biopolymer transport system component